jgi:hypothetical protein
MTFFISHQKSKFLSANLLALEPFAPFNGVTRGPSPMGGTSIFSYIYDCDDDGEIGGMNDFGRGNRSTRRKPAPTPFCPRQIPLAKSGSEPGPPRWEASD